MLDPKAEVHMKFRLSYVTGLALGIFCFSYAQENTPMINVNVKGNKEKKQSTQSYVKSKNITKPKEKVTRKLIQKLTSSGGANVFQALELLPSVNFQTQDPYGLAGGEITIRGFNNNQIGLTMDGMPLNDSGNYALYPNEYMDLENLQVETINRGGLGPKSPLYSNIGGRIGLTTLAPRYNRTLTLEQSFGSYGYEKTFVRADSGFLPLMNSRFFMSYSHAQANKFTGVGQDPKFRDHVAFGWNANLNRLHIKFYMDKNTQVNYYYRSLNYQQALNLSNYTTYDFLPAFTGNLQQDANYYKFFHNPYTNYEFRGDISLDISPSTYISLKPYYWIGKGYGSSAYYYNYLHYSESENYTHRPGFIASFHTEFKSIGFDLGYWYERAHLEDFNKAFKITQTLPYVVESFNNYGYIDDVYTITNSPYILVSYKNPKGFDIEVGLKYPSVERRYTDFYTNNLPYFSGDDIFNYSGLQVNPNNTYSRTYRKLLPSLSLGYHFNKMLFAYFNYAKNFQVPGDYQGSPPPGTTSQEIINNLSPEEADTYDLGLNINLPKLYIKPDIYYVDYKNKIEYFAEPNNPNITYPQNVGKVKAYGYEILLTSDPIKNLNIISSLSYNRSKFDNGYYSGSEFLNVAGNQLPNVPKYMFKLGVDYKLFGFDIFPYMIYESSRYGDSTNTQEIPSYTVFNANISRNFHLFGKKYYAFINLFNITNKKYIGYIGTGGTSGSYYLAPPFTISGGIRAEF